LQQCFAQLRSKLLPHHFATVDIATVEKLFLAIKPGNAKK